MTDDRRAKRIVVLGGGFAGAYCAQALQQKLRRDEAEVLLIDRHNYFIFYPLLVEAGTGSLEPRHAVVSIRSFLGGGTFRMGEVTGLDPDSRRVHYRVPDDGGTGFVEYDCLVIALGSVTRLPDVPGLGEHGFEVKSMSDAVALRDRAIEMLERADASEDVQTRRALLHFVVAGANFTGVEVAGEISTFLRGATRHFGSLRPDDVSVTLIELADRILPALEEDLAQRAAEHMGGCGISIRLKQSIERIDPGVVHLSTGEKLSSRTVIWCAGVAPPALVKNLPFPRDERGYLTTERDMRIPGHAAIWAIGDCAVNRGPDGTPYPATAQHAIQEGRHVAQDIVQLLRGHGTRPANLASKGSIAATGCRTAVAKVFGFKLAGFPAWWLYRTVYLLKMPGFARKIRIALDWTIDLLFPRDYVQLSVHRRRDQC